MCATPACAIFWNNDPSHGVTSADGLSDRIDWFSNTYMLTNLSNGRLGTTTLLDAEWAITARHLVRNGDNYSQIATPQNIYLNLEGKRYYADQIFTPDGVSDIALVHLRGGVTGAIDLTAQINSSQDEAGRLVHIGGYGYSGHFDAGGSFGLGTFHRAYNVGTVATNGQIRIVADGEISLADAGLLEGTVGSGDSGGPLWVYTGSGIVGSGFDVENASPNDWKLAGLASTGSGGSSGEAWGGTSNYTRVADFAAWINSTHDSLPAPGPSSTGPWTLHSGSGLYDTGGDKLSVTGSSGAPAVHAAFGPGGRGYTLNSIGDRLSMSATFDTTLPLGSLKLRFGIFDDEDGTIAGDTPGMDAWNGYLAGTAGESAPQGIFEKGAGGGGTGAWWNVTDEGSASLVGQPSTASGTFDDETGIQEAPAGRYDVRLEYKRVANGMQIDWTTVHVDESGEPTGIYSHAGTALDPTIASPSWNFNQLGFLLYDASFSGTLIVDDLRVLFTNSEILAGDYNLDGRVDAGDYTVWRNTFGDESGDLPADGDHNGKIDAADYAIWKRAYASTGTAAVADVAYVPEPSRVALACAACFSGLVIRPRRRRGVDSRTTSLSWRSLAAAACISATVNSAPL